MGYPTGIENIPFIKTGKRTTTIDAHTFPDEIVHVAVGLYSSSSGLYGVVLANGDLYIKSNMGMTNSDAINFRSAYGFTGSWQKFKTGVAKVDTGGSYLHVLYKNRTLERYTSSNTMPTNLGTAQAMWDGISSEFVYVKADGTLNNTVFPTNKSFVAVRIGQRGTMALASDATLYYAYSSGVVQIGTNVKEMSMSGGSTGRLNYLKHDGTVWSAVAVDIPSFAQVTGFPSSVKSLVDVVDGQTYALLVDGSVYSWSAPGAAAATSIVTDSGYISIYGDGGEFITNNTPGKPIPDHIPDTLRVTRRPVFEVTVNDDIENDAQSFVLQLATNSDFTQGLLEFKSHFRVEGWEYFDGQAWQPFPYGTGTIPATNEGRKIRYTIGGDPHYGMLVDGTTYYWRMAAVDGTTGTFSEWTDQQTLTNLLGSNGACDSLEGWITTGQASLAISTTKIQGSASIETHFKSVNSDFTQNSKLGFSITKGKYYLFGGAFELMDSGGKAYCRLYSYKSSRTPSPSIIIPEGPFKTYLAAFQATEDETEVVFNVKDYGQSVDYKVKSDALRVYEITKAEYDLIRDGTDPRYSGDMLAVMYPYVDNTQTIQRKTRIRCGTTLAVQTKPIKTTAQVDRSVFSKFATLPINVPAVKRVDNNDPSIVYTGTFYTGNASPASGGDYKFTDATGASIEYPFYGTGVRWMAQTLELGGIVNVYLDDIFIKSVDTYTSKYLYQQILYEILNLPYGRHKIKLVNTGTKNTGAKGTYIYLDAFEILDTKAPAVLTVQASNNANDAAPCWEDVTDVFLSGEQHFFANNAKTASEWGLSVKVLVDAKDRLDPIEIDAIGFSYE
ncbi:hypothetical protein HPY31_20360 [Brevibacillus sp. HB1.3]|uniref:hypothetical protein n=1 Tax=Brevibacillus sp. HB1.3 TaxID=2738842 RepID=UPI001552E162|nr:hypothetical protein [Brevibacillus sp. HB1.3]NQF16238.1 hypothetical protein [Brevibacillus sp. HB1.3]